MFQSISGEAERNNNKALAPLRCRIILLQECVLINRGNANEWLLPHKLRACSGTAAIFLFPFLVPILCAFDKS
jgi:hypothetical protein